MIEKEMLHLKKSLIKYLLVSMSALSLIAYSPYYANAQDDTEESTEEVVDESEETTDEEASTEETDAQEEAESTADDAEGLDIITKADLLAANGQDGNPAYVAVFGYVYDVTDNEAWEGGEHNGAKAGTDASADFVASPHAQDLLAGLERVGIYGDWEISNDLLANFNGENEDLPILVAVRGTVYDMTDIGSWEGGEHNGVKAGTDATEAFSDQSPHEDELLASLKVVGRHIDFVFSEEELASFNGQDGKPAYIAVDGTVYDVTNFDAWEGGEHQGQVTAGTDASEIFTNDSPHDTAFLEVLPVAGKFE